MRLLREETGDSIRVELVEEASTVISGQIAQRQRQGSSDAFAVCDLGEIVQTFKLWTKLLPRIKPFFDMPVCADKAVVTVLAQLGSGFSCSRKSEVKALLDLEIPMSMVVYTSPCKLSSQLKYVANQQIDLLTFDCRSELQKIKTCHPSAKASRWLLLKICHPHSSAEKSFGCQLKNVPSLLSFAAQLNMNVVGISVTSADEYPGLDHVADVVAHSWMAFDLAERNGYHLNVLDVGGCFPARHQVHSLSETFSSLSSALDVYFPKGGSDVDIIAIAGHVFIESAFTLATRVVDKRVIQCSVETDQGSTAERKFVYYLSDGVYGSFGAYLCDHETAQPQLVDAMKYVKKPKYSTSLHGPTYDSIDCIASNHWLPELEAGDWLLFNNAGYYSQAQEMVIEDDSDITPCFYFIQDINWIRLCMSFSCSEILAGPKLTISTSDRDFRKAGCDIACLN